MGGTKVTTSTVFTGDTTVYAHWTVKSTAASTIAHQLGMNNVFRELQELSFANRYPLRYKVLYENVLLIPFLEGVCLIHHPFCMPIDPALASELWENCRIIPDFCFPNDCFCKLNSHKAFID